MSDQTSIISYVAQPFFIAGSCTLVGYDSVDSIDNSNGIFDPKLSNYSTINVTKDAESFAVQIDFDKQSAHLANSNMSVGLIGCALLTYEDDGGAPDMSSEFSENIACNLSSDLTTISDELSSFAHNSQDSIDTFCAQSRPSIISGGRANLIFNGLGASGSGSTATIYATIERTAADALARPHAKLIVGHLFVGIDLTVTINPNSYSWAIEVENERFAARDYGSINSDGTLVKRSTGELIKIPNYDLIGSEITAIATEIAVTQTPNYFDLTKVNTSYPLLFNSFPAGLVKQSTVTVDQLNLTARQNFFSIYGFLEDPLEIIPDNYRDSLDSLYRARYRIKETR